LGVAKQKLLGNDFGPPFKCRPISVQNCHFVAPGEYVKVRYAD
jgi:hypothetical protein